MLFCLHTINIDDATTNVNCSILGILTIAWMFTLQMVSQQSANQQPTAKSGAFSPTANTNYPQQDAQGPGAIKANEEHGG